MTKQAKSRSLTYTIFDNIWPKKRNVHRHTSTWKELVAFINNQENELYDEKTDCPLISLCSYGKTLSPKGYLRHAGNVKTVNGVEIDYDDGKVSPEDAAARFRKAKIPALIYTSPSHKPDFPKWRALLPLSKPVAPDRRAEMVGKANRILDGIVARESFTLSQSFYIGHVRKAEYEVYESEGRRYIDRLKERPLYPKSEGSTGDSPDGVAPLPWTGSFLNAHFLSCQ